jgi:hypothetical protein
MIGVSPKPLARFYPLSPIRSWLEHLQVKDRRWAILICTLIPCSCPFERDIHLLGRMLFHVPPLCHLNPFYDELVGLRFRALCYLTDQCGEDVSRFC